MSSSHSTSRDSSLLDVRALAADRRWRALVERVSPLSEDDLLAEPEVAFHYADGLWHLGESLNALAVAEQVEPRIRQQGNRRLLLNLINVIGMAYFESGRAEEAEERFGDLLECATEWEDEEFAARASNNLGVLANVRGRRDLALTYYERALASYQRLGYLRGLAQTYHNLGISYRDLGFDREADTHFLRAIEFGEASGSEDVVAQAETERAMLRARAGDGALAASLARWAIQRFEKIGDPLGRADALRVLAAAARAEGDESVALVCLEEAFTVARSSADPLLRAEVQRDRGLLLRDQGKLDEAREALLDAAESFAVLGATAEEAAVRAIADALHPPKE